MRICWHKFAPYQPGIEYQIGCDFLGCKSKPINLIYKCQKCGTIKSVLDLSLRTCKKLMKKYS